jgi:hypothetical protein
LCCAAGKYNFISLEPACKGRFFFFAAVVLAVRAWIASYTTAINYKDIQLQPVLTAVLWWNLASLLMAAAGYMKAARRLATMQA